MRFRVIEDCRGTWPVHELCRVLGLSTAGYYAWRSRPESKRAAEDRTLLDDIRRAHEGSGGRYGSPRVHATLRAHGRKVGRGRVERLMRRHGVRGPIAQRQRVQTTDSRHAFPVAPNLLNRQFTATTKPNQVWLADLTYIATGEGGLYVAAIMDLHTRKPDAERPSEIVGWSMRDHLRAELATSALMMATMEKRSRASRDSCVTTGCRTVCSPPTGTWSTTALRPGTSITDAPWTIMSIGLRDWVHGS